MGNLNKENVYVVVDTPKKAKKLKKVLDMFRDSISIQPDHKNSCHNGIIDGWVYGLSDGEWQGINTKWIGHNNKEFKEVSIKELKSILAKEHLKVGDYVVNKDGDIDSIRALNNFDYTWFKRYATPEEIALLEGKKDVLENVKDKVLFQDKIDYAKKSLEGVELPRLEKKELKVWKWYWLNTNNVRRGNIKLQNALIYNNGKDYSYAFNWIGEFIDNFSISNNLENLICEATPQEVEEALINEAKRRYKVIFYAFEFNSDNNILYGHYDDTEVSELFNNGKWSEVINKFAELKEAHKNGAVIQFRINGSPYWYDIPKNQNPNWDKNTEYRIKPEVKPKVGDLIKYWDETESRFSITFFDEGDEEFFSNYKHEVVTKQ